MEIYIGTEKDIKNNLIYKITLNNVTYVVHYFQRNIYVFNSKCPHAQGNLLNAHYDNEFIVCPSHGIRFSLKDGSPNLEEVKDDFRNSIMRKGIDTIKLVFLKTINKNGNIFMVQEET